MSELVASENEDDIKSVWRDSHSPDDFTNISFENVNIDSRIDANKSSVSKVFESIESSVENQSVTSSEPLFFVGSKSEMNKNRAKKVSSEKDLNENGYVISEASNQSSHSDNDMIIKQPITFETSPSHLPTIPVQSPNSLLNHPSKKISSLESNVSLLKTVFGLDLKMKQSLGSINNDNTTAPMTKINVKRKNKHYGNRLFTDLHLLQALHFQQGAIWTMKFSHCGMYLCTAGEDRKVVVWSIGPAFLVNHTRERLDSYTSTSSSQREDATQTRDSNNSLHSSRSSNVSSSPRNSNSNSSFIDRVTNQLMESQSSELSNYMMLKEESGLDSVETNNISMEFKDDNRSNNKYDPIATVSSSVPQTENVHNNINNYKQSDFDFIQKTPYRVFSGHDKDIVDIAWSKSQFILSASTDKTVRLWHISKSEMLLKFVHPDILTSVAFHPHQDRFFITGCFDRRIRVWDIIPEGAVREWAQAPDIITAVSFTPDGKQVASGLINGQVYFYEYEGMKYVTQMDCRNKKGPYSTGSKVTSVLFTSQATVEDSNFTRSLTSQQNMKSSDDIKSKVSVAQRLSSRELAAVNEKNQVAAAAANPVQKTDVSSLHNDMYNKMIVTTNDSRIRLYNTEDYSLNQKFKSYTYRNTSMQIKASCSDNLKYIISGSDDGNTYVWSTSTLSHMTQKVTLMSIFNITSCMCNNNSNSNVDDNNNSSYSPAPAGGSPQKTIVGKSLERKQRKQVYKNNSYEYFNSFRSYSKFLKASNAIAVQSSENVIDSKDDNVSTSAPTNNYHVPTSDYPEQTTNTPIIETNGKTKTKKIISSPTTVSLFASTKTLETIIKNHPRINCRQNLNTHRFRNNSKIATASSSSIYNSEYEHFVKNIDTDDLSTRIVVTSDCEGRIFVLLRGIKM